MEEQSEVYTDHKGNKFWYLPSKGKDYFHRIDGPALDYIDGSKGWCLNNKNHRLDGPAVIYAGLYSMWYIDGKALNTDKVEEWLEENKVDLTTQAGQMAFKMRWS